MFNMIVDRDFMAELLKGNNSLIGVEKWKSRWCVMRKLSPVADCLHLQLYRDSKDRYKNGPTKASLSLQHFLGVESGFTLDKESNTIAIICQDVIVVLAFDSREKLIQWQVKISNNLGDDIQYLVLVSTAPSKAKLSTGPARMHIQDHRFCLTIGVPPRLAGLWDIGHLRRYGVVDGRFCFEGGSSCGKGEGLYVFVTDQSDEITHSLKLASQGRLVTKRRPIARKTSTTDSPRRTLTSTIPDVIHEHSCISQIKNSSNDQNNIMCQFGGSNNTSSYWPSQESRDLDSQFGCGDTNSVIEVNDSFNDSDINPKHIVNIERCMSCISKLGGPSISRSSTATGGNSMCNIHQHHQHQQHNQNNHNNQNQNPILDNMSLGSHGSSSNSSEYSVPRTINCKVISQTESWYEKAPTFQIDEITRTSSPCQCCHNQQHQVPNRPPKPKPHQKPPMPLPTTQQPTAMSAHVGPYENYDIPKPQPYLIDAENYDTPKKIKEVLSGTNTSCTSPDITYGNYDMPLSITKAICSCGFLGSENVTSKKDEIELEKTHIDCTCNRVMSWTDNWITLPYCRRGNGIENTGVPINRVKLSGEGRMPVMKPSGEVAIYATVDMTKKISRRLAEMENSSCECSEQKPTDDCNENENDHGNYSNIDVTQLNYANLDFEKSLENYENAKEILAKMNEDKCIEDESTGEIIKVCHNCRYHKVASNEKLCDNGYGSVDIKQEDYMMMEPGKIPNASGYIPMQPVNNYCGAPPLPSKTDILKRLLNDKSASNPTLCGPAVDRSRKRCKNERITGTAMMMLCRNAGSPYNRKQLMDSTDLLPLDKRLIARKRSSSAESSNLVDLVDDIEIEARSRKSSVNTMEGRRSSSPCLHQETELCEDESCCTKVSVVSSENDEISTSTTTNTTTTTTTSSQHHMIQNQNYIRRSASVPCKGQNRDSSSSNDSGVSTSSLRHRGGDFNELELPLSNSIAIKKYQRHILPALTCVHSSLPRRSKSFDPLREISFQFQKIKIPEKSTSAEAEVPVCPPKGKGFNSPGDPSLTGVPYIDSRSTSSGTSDMSDYIETLSLSSQSSSDTPEGMKLIRHQPTSTLRPRSGKEYQNIDRSLICLQQNTSDKALLATALLPPSSANIIQSQQMRASLLPMSANYANITPVPENVESPSPGYQSGGSSQDPGQGEHFMFKNETTTSTS